MAKAHITTKDGAKITIEGTPAEVSALIKQMHYTASQPTARENKKELRKISRDAKEKATPVNLISTLIDGGFFKKPKDLAAVRVALEELGHVYPVTTLSPVLLRLVRKRQLRRLKEKKRWLYTG
jgi:hypothetical protein